MTGIGGPSPHADSPQNPRNNKCFSMALSPRGQFSRSLNIMTSFPHFRYQNTQKVMPLNILLRGKKKKKNKHQSCRKPMKLLGCEFWG